MALTLSELIHPTAVIDPDAVLAGDVQVGPYAIIEGPGRGRAGLRDRGTCLPFWSAHHGRRTTSWGMGRSWARARSTVVTAASRRRVRIGDENVFREFVTVHRGTVQGNGVTWIGDRNMFMIGSHLGHDVQVGRRLHGRQQRLGGRSRHACRRLHPLRPHGRPAAGARRAAGHARRHGFHLQGHPSLHPPAGAELRHRAERDRPATCAMLARRDDRRPAAELPDLLPGGTLAERGPRPDREPTWATIAEVAEFVTFIRESKIGINPARSVERASGTSDQRFLASPALRPSTSGLGVGRGRIPAGRLARESLAHPLEFLVVQLARGMGFLE